MLPSALQPCKKEVCLEMLQCEGFGVTKERCECVCCLYSTLREIKWQV